MKLREVETDTDWMHEALCADHPNANIWFPEGKGFYAGQASAAKAICAECPVKAECLEHALRNREPHGIYGGTTEAERRRIRRQRALARRRAS